MNSIHEMLIAQGKMNDPDPYDPADNKDAPIPEPYKGLVHGSAPTEPLPVISSHLPDLVDQYITIRAQRLALQKQVDEMEEAEKGLNKTIVAKFREGGYTAMGGTVGIVKMHESTEPIAEDWPKIWTFIEQNEAWELLHKRLTVTAVKERWEHGEEVPGVGRVPKYSLSVSKS